MWQAILIAPDIAVAPCPVSDSDGDLVCDFEDNCTDVQNSSQCDTDEDDYGNVCDGDFNNDLSVDGVDFSEPNFLTDFFAGADSGIGSDMNCDGAMDGADFSFFLDRFQAGSPGP